MTHADDTDEYAALDAHDPTSDSPSDLAYFSSLDAPRWAILLAAIGLACAGAVLVREAAGRIAGAFLG